MTLTQLEYFVEIVEAGNFTKAANKIFVSQPTLSRTVQNMEKELGTILIDRDSKDMELTKDGEIVYKYASEVLSLVNAKTIEMKDKLGNSDGVIRLGITPTTDAMYFHSAIYDFHKKYPVANLQIEEVATRKGLEMLLDGQLDLSVDIDPEERDEFIKRPVIKSEAVLVVSRNHRLGNRRVVSFSELMGEKMVMVGKDYSYYEIVSNKLREAGIEPDFEFESGQWEFLSLIHISEPRDRG